MFGLAIAVLFALAVGAVLSLSLYKFDRDSCLLALRRIAKTVGKGWGWMLAGVVLLMQVYGLTQLHEGLMDRLSQQGQARYIASQDPGGSATTQRTPRVSYLETTQRTQRLVVPPQATTLETLPGWTPEEARYGGAPALNVQDELVKDDKTIVINRTISTQRYVPTKLLRSDVSVKLGFKDGSPNRVNQVYQADFNGRYTFQNSFAEARKFHFSFPLPDNSGTLAGFRFKVNGKEMVASDIDQGLEWEGELKPQEQVVVEIGYTHQGAKAWSYDVAGRREPIADFHLNVQAGSADVKFLRGSLYPTKVEGGVLTWDLQNQITSQSISLFFPHIPTEQIVGSLYVFAPAALVIFIVMVVVWAKLRPGPRGEMGTTPWRAVLACLSACAGYTLASYLIGYMHVTLALLLGFATSAGLQYKALGDRLLLPIYVGTLAPFAFLAAGHTGLLLTVLGVCSLALTITETAHRRERYL